MSFDTIRINELAKELKLTSKEVIEKLAQISITGKTHSSTLTVDQVRRLKDYINAGSVKEVKKPKAFIVKKAKTQEKEVKVVKEEKKVEEEKKPVIERPRVEVVKPQSRLEIVRRAPRPTSKPDGEKPERPQFRREDGKKFPPRQNGEKTDRAKKPFPPRDGQAKTADGKRPERPGSGVKKPIERHIISQDIYETKGPSKKRSDNKKKDKEFNKKEEQERISLEKAAAQKHKKKIHKEEAVEEVKSIVVNQAMTISELSEKIQRTPAEIVKFLMMNGVMATVNQLIDIDVIKKICAEYGLEVLDV